MTNYFYKWSKKTGKVSKVKDLLTWSRWFEKADRHVAQSKLKNGKLVSTIFLGLDHNFSSKGRPILFETMVFSARRTEKSIFASRKFHKSLDEERYYTQAEALKGHKRHTRKWSKK